MLMCTLAILCNNFLLFSWSLVIPNLAWRGVTYTKAMRKKTISTFLCFASFKNGRFPILNTGTKISHINWIYGILWKLMKLTKLTKHTKNRSKTYIFNLKMFYSVWIVYTEYPKMANFQYPKPVQKYCALTYTSRLLNAFAILTNKRDRFTNTDRDRHNELRVYVYDTKWPGPTRKELLTNVWMTNKSLHNLKMELRIRAVRNINWKE